MNRSLDYEWDQEINLQIVPNPKLSLAQRAAVAAEYRMTDEHLTKACRLSMTFYLINEHNLDIEGLKPEKQQLVLLNLSDVVTARQTARKLSKEALARNSPL